MTRRTLVPMDGSVHSRRGLEHALAEHGESQIVVLHVVDPIELSDDLELSSSPELSDWQLWCDRATEEANEVFADAQAIADGYSNGISTATTTGRPKDAIVEYVTEHDVDHVVMGSRGRTDDPDISLGSVAETVLRRSPVLVTVVR